MILRRVQLSIICLWAFAITLPAATHAQNYPTRPVTLLTSAPAGSGPDVITRIAADGLTGFWKQQVVVENRPGGRGVVATLAVTRAANDGYTLYVALGSTYTVLPEIQTKLPFDLQRDLTPIALIGEQPFVIAADPKLGLNTLGDLIARAKANPGNILYGTPRGSLPHLVMELLQHRAGTTMTLVPYPATPKIVGDVLGGRIALAVESLSGLGSMVRSGQIKGLAVTSAQRVPEFPDLPTVAELYPGFEGNGWFVLTAPAGAPHAVLQQVNKDLRAVLNQPVIKAKFAKLGTYSRSLSPDEVADYVRRQRATWGPIVRQSNLKIH